MRRVVLMLSFLALLAVVLVGFLVMQKRGQAPLVSHSFQRVIPDPDNTYNTNNINNPFDNDNVAQAPPMMTPPPAVPTTPPTATPAPAPAQVDTIDASAPPAAPPTKIEGNTPTTAAQPAPVKEKGTFDENGVFTLQKEMQKNGFHKGEPVVVVVDKGSHFTYVLQKQGDKVVIVDRASNAVGKSDTPSPPGPYKISEITKMPVWVPTKSIDPDQKPVQPFNKDHNNPLGVARIRLNKFDVALHGTNSPNSIRKDASHGCIRHSNEDISRIVSEVSKGETVIITDQFVGTKINKDMFNG